MEECNLEVENSKPCFSAGKKVIPMPNAQSNIHLELMSFHIHFYELKTS